MKRLVSSVYIKTNVYSDMKAVIAEKRLSEVKPGEYIYFRDGKRDWAILEFNSYEVEADRRGNMKYILSGKCAMQLDSLEDYTGNISGLQYNDVVYVVDPEYVVDCRNRVTLVRECYEAVVSDVSTSYLDDVPSETERIMQDYLAAAAEEWGYLSTDDAKAEFYRIYMLVEDEGRDEAAAWS